jgi:hypothetical protein
MKGSVLELKSLITNKELFWSSKMGLDDRCMFIEGDVFREFPSVDAYIMKMILHDWNDEECVKILNNINRSCSYHDGRVFIVENI